MILMSVDLPAPFSPSSAWMLPASSLSPTPRRALTPGKDLTMPLSSSAVAMSACPQAAAHAETIGSDRAEDHASQRELDVVGIDPEDDQRLCYQRYEDDTAHRSRHADAAAGQYGAPDDGGREGRNQPVVPDRRLPDLKPRYGHDAGRCRDDP